MDEWVKDRLLDDNEQEFSSTRRRRALNVAAMLVQRKVQTIDPDAFRRIYTRNLLVDESRYQLPRGFLRMKLVQIDGAKGVAVPEEWIAEADINPQYQQFLSGVDAAYALAGGEIEIYPTPTADVEDGLSFRYVPALQMSDDDDDLGDFGLVEPLHMAVVLWAVRLLKPETGEGVQELDAEIKTLLDDIGVYYPRDQVTTAPAHSIRLEGLGKQVVGY